MIGASQDVDAIHRPRVKAPRAARRWTRLSGSCWPAQGTSVTIPSPGRSYSVGVAPIPVHPERIASSPVGPFRAAGHRRSKKAIRR
jgi:hypothetical protein